MPLRVGSQAKIGAVFRAEKSPGFHSLTIFRARRWEGSSSVVVSNCEMFDPDSDSWSVMDMPPIGGGGVGSVKLFVVPKSVEEVDCQTEL